MPYPQLILPKERQLSRRLSRTIRAVWHDSRALVREFNKPLWAILLALFVGGWVYGELHVFAGHEPIPLIDLPYIMLALMILEAPLDLPDEWFLIVFWYGLPAIAVYIIGQGAVDFVRLFFNRTERRSAWELAVAQTYRNHIIVVGAGHVGLRVARTLVQLGFEVVVVDNHLDADSDAIISQLNIPVIAEDARLLTTLKNAGIEYARTLLVCTSNDHLNLELTMRARDLNPDVRIIARMWDAGFTAQLKRFLNVEVMSASDLAAPAFAGSAVGIEISQTMRIGKYDYSMIKLKVTEGSFMEGKTIDFLQEDEEIDIVLHEHNGHDADVHPAGETIVKAHDTLVLFARHSKITEIVARNQKKQSS